MFLLPKDYWEIRQTAHKGRGAFAKKHIPAGTVIGDYIGTVISSEDEEKYEKDEDGLYLMYLTENLSIYPNIDEVGIHLVNHSCAPSAWLYTYKGHTLYTAIRNIFPGEEITIDYLLEPQDTDCAPCTHICRCDSLICHQTMHMSEKKSKAWEKVLDEELGEVDESRITIGKRLPLLPSYPKHIGDNAIYTLFGNLHVPPLIREDKKIPSKTDIRRLIRETGKTLWFNHLGLHLVGVVDDLLISQERQKRL